MLNTNSLERESWRVMEDDSKDEKSGREVGGKCPASELASRSWDSQQRGVG